MTATHTSCFRLSRKRGRHWQKCPKAQRGNREEGRGKKEEGKEKDKGGDAGEIAMGCFDVVISIRQDIKD
jgi:hypothetical protein